MGVFLKIPCVLGNVVFTDDPHRLPEEMPFAFKAEHPAKQLKIAVGIALDRTLLIDGVFLTKTNANVT